MSGTSSHGTTQQDLRCPVRPDEPCRLCHPGSRGPDSCGLVYLVMTDPELRALLCDRTGDGA